MKKIYCAICQDEDYTIKYPERIDYTKIDFSPRRAPDRNHCRIVQCKKCGLVFANPIFDDDYILDLYRNFAFINELQVDLMGEDYLEQLRESGSVIGGKGNLLEIGCGNGCFLKKAKEFGFNVYGVEPGKNAVDQADQDVKGNIINDVFKAGLYEEKFFDLVCVIQVFDHLIDPNDVLRNIRKVMKENGHILVVSHNVRFYLTRILGEKSSMYDIEHIYLFDKVTIKKLLEKHGFQVIYVKDMMSRYTIGHIIKMFPFPDFARHFLTKTARRLGIIDKRIKIMGGNMVALAKKVDNATSQNYLT